MVRLPDVPVRRLLMTADTVGGVWTYALELARALQSYHVEVVLATMGAPLHERQRQAVLQIENITLRDSIWKLEWMADPWADVQAAGAWLLDLATTARPDVIHLNGYVHAALPWHAPVLVVGHSCVLSWFTAVQKRPAPALWERYGQEVRRGLAAADLVTAPTRAMLEALRVHHGDFAAAPVIPNGRQQRHFFPRVKKRYILAAGRLWDKAKNIEALTRVVRQLSWPVAVAGERCFPEGGAVRLDGVRYLGQLAPDHLARWLGHAAIFALPARYEPFGLSILEAGLAGCALVLGDIPSLREVWDEAALFVPPDEPEALVEALERLSRDDQQRQHLAGRARERAARYSPERMAHAYMALYTQLIGLPQRP